MPETGECPTCGRPATHVIVERSYFDTTKITGPFCESHVVAPFEARRYDNDRGSIRIMRVEEVEGIDA